MRDWNFLVILRPLRAEMLTEGPTPEEQRIIGDHFAYYSKLIDDGDAFLVGRTQESTPETMGLAIIRAESAEAARSMASNDPAVAESVMSCEVRPYRIALLSKNNYQESP